jgi:hypothetical protein
MMGISTSVEVYVHPQAVDLSKDAAAALVANLNGILIDAALKNINDPNNPTNAIRMNVGVKP